MALAQRVCLAFGVAAFLGAALYGWRGGGGYTAITATPTSSLRSASGKPSDGQGSSTTGPNAGAGSAGDAGSIHYPRLSWDVSGYGQKYAVARAALIAYTRHMDVMVIGADFEGAAAANGFEKKSLVNAMIAGDGVVVPKVQQYTLPNNFDSTNASAPSTVATPIWAAQLKAMSRYWFLWRPDIAPDTHVHSGPVGNWLTNAIDASPSFKDFNGNGMEAAFAKYQDDYYRTGKTADAALNISGPFHDVFVQELNSPSADYFVNGVIEPGNDVAVNAAWRAGQLEYINWYRVHAPGQFVMANINVQASTSDDPRHALYQRPPSATAPLYGALDAAMNESPIGLNSDEHYRGFEDMRVLTQFIEHFVKHPQYNMFVHYGINPANGEDQDRTASVGQALRYGMCAALTISSSTYTFFDGSRPDGAYEALYWFDYFAVNPATGVALDYATSSSAQIAAARYWLGTPIDLIQTAPTRGKVYARRFRMPNGRTALVLVNPSANGGNPGAAPQTIDLTAVYGGSWTHVRASSGTNVGSNPQVDNGAMVSSVTVPVGDGMILIQVFYLIAVPRRREMPRPTR